MPQESPGRGLDLDVAPGRPFHIRLYRSSGVLSPFVVYSRLRLSPPLAVERERLQPWRIKMIYRAGQTLATCELSLPPAVGLLLVSLVALASAGHHGTPAAGRRLVASSPRSPRCCALFVGSLLPRLGGTPSGRRRRCHGSVRETSRGSGVAAVPGCRCDRGERSLVPAPHLPFLVPNAATLHGGMPRNAVPRGHVAFRRRTPTSTALKWSFWLGGLTAFRAGGSLSASARGRARQASSDAAARSAPTSGVARRPGSD